MDNFFKNYFKVLGVLAVVATLVGIPLTLYGYKTPSPIIALLTVLIFLVPAIPPTVQRILLRSKRVYLIHGWDRIQCELEITINSAKRYLCCTGSRSRDPRYLLKIHDRLRESKELSHYRILFGPPHRRCLVDHLQSLLKIRPTKERVNGVQTLHIGFINNSKNYFEFYLTGNENRCLIILPSWNEAGTYDSALLINDSRIAMNYIRVIQALFKGSEPIDSASRLKNIGLLRQD